MSEDKMDDYEKAKADFIKELMKPENKLLKDGILWLGAVIHEWDKKMKKWVVSLQSLFLPATCYRTP